tara:strand:+ start:1572 stop:1745 length:174 start_codon:yes stop_codon:yes gene_type:complete
MELIMNYEVLAGTVGGKPAGSIITDADLDANTNIEALISGGSIKPITAKTKKDEAAE